MKKTEHHLRKGVLPKREENNERPRKPSFHRTKQRLGFYGKKKAQEDRRDHKKKCQRGKDVAHGREKKNTAFPIS